MTCPFPIPILKIRPHLARFSLRFLKSGGDGRQDGGGFRESGLFRLYGRHVASAVGQRGIAVVDVAEGGHVGILLLVGSLQLLHHGVYLRLLPHVVLLHAGLVYGLCLLQEHLVLGLKVSDGIVRSATKETLATERTQESAVSCRRGSCLGKRPKVRAGVAQRSQPVGR